MLAVTRGVVQPVWRNEDAGVMVTIVADGGEGYAATTDLSAEGLRCAAEEARAWARRTGTRWLAGPGLACHKSPTWGSASVRRGQSW